MSRAMRQLPALRPARLTAALLLAALLLGACKPGEPTAAAAPAGSGDAASPTAAAAPAPAAAEAAAEDKPAEPARPQPSEMAPLASRSLLLRVVRTGKHLIAVGERGNLIASNDGRQWAQVPMPVRSMLTGVSFADPDHGWAVGHDAAIVVTRDAGRTWTLQHYDAEKRQPLLDVLFIDGSHGYAVGAFGSFLATRDGGQNWTEVAADEIRADTYHLNAITRTRAGVLVVAGESGLVGVSIDGSSWSRAPVQYEGSLFGAAPLGEKGAIVFGLRGTAFRSEDVAAGVWTKLELGTTQSAFGAAVLDDGSVVLVGADGLAAAVGSDGSVDLKRYVSEGHGGATYSSAIVDGEGLLVTGDLGIEHLKRAR